MKLKQVFCGILIALALWHCEAGTALHSRQINRKQKKLIEGSMDLTAEPCNDFYKYACGNWILVNSEAGIKYYEPITLLDYNVNLEMSRAFNHFSMRNKPKFIKEAYFYYKSCKNLSPYEAINYLVWLKSNDGFKWPALWTQAKKSTQFDWVQTLAKMRTYGFNEVFVKQIVMSKLNDAKKFVIDIDKPGAEDGSKAMTREYIKVLMESLPAKISNNDFDRLCQEIDEFEQKLQELNAIEDVEVEDYDDYEEDRLFNIKNLPFDWLRDYLKIILNQTQLDDHMQLYVRNIPYIKALDALTKQYSQRFLCKYLEIRFLWYLHTTGPANFIDRDCLASTRGLMPIAMHWQYEQHHPELQREYTSVYDIFNEVRKHFNNTLIRNKHGFNATVIHYLQNKINRMNLRLNNVPRLDTVDTLEKFYRDLSLDGEKFYENHLKLLRFNFIAHRSLLGTSLPVLDFTYLENSETGSSSSPYFVQNANTIFVPLTLLQQPIYSPGLDDIYKYSSVGFLLAHEMFHGFDDSGLLTDANGSFVSLQFEENPLFNVTFNCLLEINPQVISEKIADISGLRYSYQAFFDAHSEACTQTTTFHGQQMSLRKIFFLNFAQFFCGGFSEEMSATSEHGSDIDRVIDALSHFPEFSKEFNCNSSHRLYPHETCHLWR